MYCPRCNVELREQPYSKIHLYTCPECLGTWYEGDSIARLFKLKDKDDLFRESKNIFNITESELICPKCDINLEAKTFKKRDLTIDQCKQCGGLWLDKDELGKTKFLLKEYFGPLYRERIKKLSPFRAYPAPKHKSQKKVLPNISLKKKKIKVNEDALMREIIDKSEPTLGLYLFMLFTGLPVEVYNPPRKNPPIITFILILVNVIIYFLSTSMGLVKVINSYGAIPSHILAGKDILTLFTYMFLHGGLFHLIGNMYFLWTFGDNVEDKLGHFKFLIFYIGCGLISALCQLFVMSSMGIDNMPLCGASGAIAGVMGAYLYLFPNSALYQMILFVPVKIPIVIYCIFWVLIQLMGHYVAHNKNVAWWAHLSGFIVGFIIAYIIYNFDKKVEKFQPYDNFEF